MGSLINKNKSVTVDRKTSIKSKGERLGWESLSKKKPVSLKKAIGEGKVVSRSSIAIHYSKRNIL